VKVIFLKSFFASKFKRTESNPYGFKLIYTGIEQIPASYFYSNCERDVDTWIHNINKCTEHTQFEKKYKVIRKIGKGRFSIVYLCADVNTNEEFAVKAIAKNKLNKKERKLLYNEIMIIKELQYKFIVRSFEVIENETHIYIVMERIEGGELLEFFKERQYFDEFEVAYVVYFVLNALIYLHSVGIMHRDIKPDNLLIELDDSKQRIVVVKVGDFGLSSITLPNIPLNDPCGTPAYAAPEILNRGGYNTQVDLWSLGIVTFFLYFLFKGLEFEGSCLSRWVVGKNCMQRFVIKTLNMIKNGIQFQQNAKTSHKSYY
jgi:serine/threonine protein kinase